MMNLGIVGLGVVGGALADWLTYSTQHKVKIIDPPKGLLDEFSDVKAIFICIPVPTMENGDQFLDDLDKYVSNFSFKYKGIPIFVRSTVLPTTCDKLSEKYSCEVIAMPEFLTHHKAGRDMNTLPILAGIKGKEDLVVLCKKIFYEKEVIQLTNIEAESAKYVHNAYCAIKVNYFNVASEVCHRLGVDYKTVLEAARITGFIGMNHHRVPGPDGKFGYGGACLPKDLKAFGKFLHDINVNGAMLMDITQTLNSQFRSKVT